MQMYEEMAKNQTSEKRFDFKNIQGLKFGRVFFFSYYLAFVHISMLFESAYMTVLDRTLSYNSALYE